MSKKILVIYYSQTGQLKEVVTQFLTPFIENGMEVDIESIDLTEDFSFPWTGERFFDAMPESVLGIPRTIKSFKSKESSYDLIVFAYQPWFLSPSIPATSMLKHPDFKKILKGKNVVTLIGSRNLWIAAQEKVKVLLDEAGATLVGNIVLVDRNNYLASAVSILYWMLNGKKEKLWGIFPIPGISKEDIDYSSEYGRIISKRVIDNNFLNLQKELIEKGAVEVKSNLMFIENRAIIFFTLWANLITRKKNRAAWLTAFKYYLVIALFIVSPIVLAINTILFRPFLLKSNAKKKKYYLGIN